MTNVIDDDSSPQARSRQILDVSAGLFARQGASATTVRQIAAEVGMKSGSLYHHFESKDAILAEILRIYMRDLLASYHEAQAEAARPDVLLRKLIAASLEASSRHTHAAQIYQVEIGYLRSSEELFSESLEIGRLVQEIWLATIEMGVQEGIFTSEVPASTFYRMLRDSLWLSVRWYKPTPDYRPAQLADEFAAVFLDGFRVKEHDAGP